MRTCRTTPGHGPTVTDDCAETLVEPEPGLPMLPAFPFPGQRVDPIPGLDNNDDDDDENAFQLTDRPRLPALRTRLGRAARARGSPSS